MPANKTLDEQAIADIQRRCRSVAERLEALAGSPHDLIASANPDQGLLLEAASLVRGYHQCLLVESVLKRSASSTGKPRKKNAATVADDEYFRSGTRYPGQ